LCFAGLFDQGNLFLVFVERTMTHKRYSEFAEEWNCDEVKLCDAFIHAKELGTLEHHNLIAFLIAKNIKNKNIIYPEDSHSISSLYSLVSGPIDSFWKECRQRLDRIMNRAGKTNDKLPDTVQSLEQFLTKVPDWRTNSYIFPKNNNIALKQISQRSGLCFINAPEILQYYLVAKNNRPNETGMIDTLMMIRNCWDNERLKQHIFQDTGGSSVNLLREILEPNSLVTPTSKFETHFKKYGPLLISGFVVHEDFLMENKHSHDDEPQGDVVGTHAMIIIGTRRDTENRLWFLVQNWWDSKQFVEISKRYLVNSRAVCFVVKTKQKIIPKEFPTHFHTYAESEHLDKSEQLIFEDPVCPVPRSLRKPYKDKATQIRNSE
jgi:hypothetical protein